MKNITIIICLILFQKLYSQEYSFSIKGITYTFCTSLTCAKQNNPDSVKGLVLQSRGYKDFPIEVLKYKNIEILDFSSKKLDEMFEYLNRKERKIFNKRKKHGGENFGYPDFRINRILTIPDEIASLQKLKLINLMDTYTTIDAIKKLERLLPNCEIMPSSKFMEDEEQQRKEMAEERKNIKIRK